MGRGRTDGAQHHKQRHVFEQNAYCFRLRREQDQGTESRVLMLEHTVHVPAQIKKAWCTCTAANPQLLESLIHRVRRLSSMQTQWMAATGNSQI
jgi:hypothetical protein